MTDRERREASDVPGYGRVGGIDDPVPRAQYGDATGRVRKHARKEAEREATAREDRRAELLDLPNELRGDIRSFYDGEMEIEGFVRRIRSIRDELERHADAIEARDEQPDTGDGESA
jgi:hypothetical protein